MSIANILLIKEVLLSGTYWAAQESAISGGSLKNATETRPWTQKAFSFSSRPSRRKIHRTRPPRTTTQTRLVLSKIARLQRLQVKSQSRQRESR